MPRDFVLLILITCLTPLLGFSGCSRQDSRPVPVGIAPAEEDQAVVEEPSTDLYELPADNVDSLEQFIDRIDKFRPGDTNEMLEHERRSPDALRRAARRIMALTIDSTSSAYKKASAILLEEAIESIDQATPEQVTELYEQLHTSLCARQLEQPLVARDMRLALDVIQQLERQDMSQARMAYRRFGLLFDESQDLELSTMARMLQGAARRLELPGNVMHLTGTRMDGSKLNLDSLRGHVVLIDFWATWCGPCVAEHPRIVQAYRKYHNQGFEVIGVSLDVDRQRLEEYLAEHDIPWTTLHPGERGKQNPVLERYGIMSIPVVILVDRQGLVVSIDARGENLEALIEATLAESSGNE
jgi:thiol-disulfide isomerase/thioredoxin